MCQAPSIMVHRFLGCTLFACALFPLAAQEAFQLNELNAKRITIAKGAYFPRLVQAGNGDLLAFFKTGAAHIGKSGRASMARSVDGGETWSAPQVVFDRPNADDGIIATGVLPGGVILAAAVSYTWSSERYSFDGWHADMWLIRSGDHGKTWSEPRPIAVAPYEWAYPFGHILPLADRSLLLTAYAGQLPMSRERENVVIALHSSDEGQTWAAPSVMARGYNEVSAALRRDGSILAVVRSSVGGHLASTTSRDGGRHWTPPGRITENNEHPGDLLRLRNGGLLLTFGQRNKPFGVQAMLSR
ncbi:MAG: sialidase family protein, partial [Bryobacteraceae bacterium]